MPEKELIAALKKAKFKVTVLPGIHIYRNSYFPNYYYLNFIFSLNF